MKTKLLLFATALLCLAACNKQEIIDGPDDQGKEGDYMIEIAELDQPTKSNPSTVELNLANLVSPSSKSITAQLKKRSGSSWVNVDNGVSYSWSATSEDNQKFSGSGTVNQSCNVTAKKAGSGNITVSAAIGGTTVATQPVPVNVSDDRALSWTNATTSLTAGEVKTAVLNSNFSGTVTVSSDNSSFLVGTSENSLNATTSVTFSSNKTQTIYYKYTGSSQTTVKIEAVFDKIIHSNLYVDVQNIYIFDFSIGCSYMGNGTDWWADVTNMILGPEDGGTEPYKIETGDINYFYFNEYDSMIHLYGPLHYFGSLSFEELRYALREQNVFITMTDGENYYDVISADIFLNGISFSNAFVCIDLEVSFELNLYKGKQFDIWFE